MKWIWYCCLPCFGIFGDSTNVPFSFEAESVSYHEQSLILKGDIHLQHELGKISADEGSVIQERESDDLYHHFSLKGHVNLQLQGGGTLDCSEAEINLKTQKGNFYGTPLAPVRYSEPSTSNPLAPPLLIKSQSTSFCFYKHQGHYPIQRIDCYKNVDIDYHNLFHINAHKACYLNHNPSELLSSTEMTLQLSPEHPEETCVITRNNGDTIYAQKIMVLRPQEVVKGSAVHGVLILEDNEPLDFNGDSLTWDQRHHMLTLTGNATAKTSDWLLHNTVELQAIQQLKGEEWQWESFRGTGPTQLTAWDAYKIERTFACQGSININQNKQECFILSSNIGEKAPAERQNHYHDHASDIYADEVYFAYGYKENEMLISLIRLKGHVRMLQHAPFDPSRKEVVEQYVLADTVEYYPEDEHLMLYANKDSRVLFLDKINGSQISAETLHIWRKNGEKKPTVQGVGNVKISLSQTELENINKAFL